MNSNQSLDAAFVERFNLKEENSLYLTFILFFVRSDIEKAFSALIFNSSP